MSSSPLYALIMAGGVGTRFGADQPKQMVHIQGVPILAHTLRKFLDFHPTLITCTVLHESLVPGFSQFAEAYLPAYSTARLRACAGGATRTESVHNGLRHLAGQPGFEDGLVAIHDGVRPLVNEPMIAGAYDLAEKSGNAVAAVPVKSSMRRKTENGSEAIDRSAYYHVQTPQVFRLQEILRLYEERPHENFTDDASLAEAAGMHIHLCEGSYDNLKLTTPEDLIIADFLMKKSQNA